MGPDLVLDSDDERVQKQGLRIGFVAASGGGKSHAIALIAEQAKQQGAQIVFFDTHGEYWTFGEVFEDLLVIGGDNADLPLMEEAVDVYAEAFRKGKSLDFSFKEIFADDEIYGRIVEKILRALWKVQVNEPRPSLWILEEAQLLCPQDKNINTIRRVGLVKSIATGGRKFGLEFLLSTQRPAEISKTPLSQCWIRFFGHLDEPLDWKAVQPLLKGVKADSLGALRTGEFYVYGWEKQTTVHRIDPKRLTRDAGKTILLAPLQRKNTAEKVSIDELRKLIENKLVNEADRQDELSSLKAKLAANERQMEELKRKADVAGVIRDSLMNPVLPGTHPVELPAGTVAKLEQVAALETELTVTKEQLADSRKEISELQPYVDLKLAMDRILTVGTTQRPVPVVDLAKPEWAVVWLAKLPESPKKILQFLIDNQGRTFKPVQLAQLTGYQYTGGAWNKAMAILRRNKLIQDTKEGVRLA